MKGDFIKREDALKSICYDCNTRLDCKKNPCADYARLRDMPAADVRENVHGEWIVIIEKDADGNGFYNCSVCGAGESHVPSNTVSYCWNCGAQMNGGDKR